MNCPHCNRHIDDEAAFCPWCCNPIPDAPTYDSYDYAAFISYRHLPREHKLATRLQRSLEGFRIPKALQEDAGSKRLGKFFRDEDELPTARSLNDQIRDALKRSPALIVICTPQTRESVWVLREVELFASFHGREHICVALCAGEPEESFPPLLLGRTVVDADGSTHEVAEEPIAADFRDGSRRQYQTELPRLAATLIGCGYDDLQQRMRARRQRLVLSLAGVIAAVSVSFGSFALWQRSQIRENYRLAQINESEMLAVQANELLAQGDRYQAVAVALAGLPKEGVDADRPFVPTTQMALERAMGLYPQPSSTQWFPEYSVLGLRFAGSHQGSNGIYAAFDTTGSIRVFNAFGSDLATFTVDARQTAPDGSGDIAYDLSPYLRVVNEQVVYVGYGYLACYDIASQKKLWSKELDECQPTSPLAANESDELLALTLEVDDTDTMRTLLIDTATGEVTRELTYERVAAPPDGATMEVPCAAFSPDGGWLAVGINGSAYVINLASGEVNSARLAQDEVVDLAFCDDSLLTLSQQFYDLASVPLRQEMAVQRFDFALREQWSFSQTEELYLIDEASTAGTFAGFRFPIDQSDEPKAWGIVALRNELYAFDTRTGAIRRHIKLDDPILDCLSFSDTLLVVTSRGDVSLLSLDEQNALLGADELGHTQVNTTRSLGAACNARFARGNGLKLLLWNDEPAKCRVYSYNVQGLITNEDYLYNSYDLGDSQIVASEHSMYADGTIYLLNHADLSVDRSIKLDDLPHLRGCDRPGLYHVAGSNLYVYGPDQSADGSVAYTIPADADQDPVALTFANMELDTENPSALAEYHDGDDCLLLAHDATRVQVVSTTSQETLLDLGFPERLNGCWLTGNVLVANVGHAGAQSNAVADMLVRMYMNRVGGIARNDGHTSLQTYAYETGERIEAPWDGLSPWNGLDSCVDTDKSGGRMVVACADGVVRQYDTTERMLLWESTAFESGLRSVYIDEKHDNVLVQDGMGYLALLSGTDGTVLKSSSLAIEGVDSYRVVGLQEDLVVGFYQRSDMEQTKGIVIISLDPDAFGPQSEINQGLFCNSTSDLVAIERDGRALICLRLNGSGLIDSARALSNGHPLTNTERLLYGLEE